jgi:hypothetical protein
MNLTREEFEARQARLRQRYEELWPGLMEILGGIGPGRVISKPFLLNLTAHSYPEASTRLLVVGQQTHDWETMKDLQGDPIKYLLTVYRDFGLGANYLRTPFWVAAHELYSTLNPTGPENGFIWTNLIKINEETQGRKDRRPGTGLEDVMARFFNVLPF